MDKKVGDIVEAFENLRFEDSLRQIDQLQKKVTKDKKKSGFTQKDDRVIHIIKCGSLASIGRIHQANKLIQTYFTDKVLAEIPADQFFLFLSIAELSYDKNILDKIEKLTKTGKGDFRLERFLLNKRKFSIVSKSFLKDFLVGKKSQDGLAQIFLQYLNQFNRENQLENNYQRDPIILPNRELNLKMVELFFTKLLSGTNGSNGINISQLKNLKLRSSIIDLKIRLAINSNKIQDAIKIYSQYFHFIEEHFIYLRSIRQIPQNQQQNINFYIVQCGRIFKKNISIQKYTPLYDYYNEFLDFVLSQKVTKSLKEINLKQQTSNLKIQQLYDFNNIADQKVLEHYYLSLLSQLQRLTTGQNHQIAKTSDYYKISIKGLFLQLLKIHYQVQKNHTQNKNQLFEVLSRKQSFNKLLDQYFFEFSKTLTYVNQMQNYLPLLKKKFQNLQYQNQGISLPKVFKKDDDNLIVLINKLKILSILNKEQFSQLQFVEKWSIQCWQHYKKFIQQVQGSKRRQKGQVFLCDEFIIIVSDIIIYFIQTSLANGHIIQTLLTKLSSILDSCTQLSPYNGYLKLRLIYCCQKLNYFDKLMDTYFSLDIKSVQFQTLGYFIQNTMRNFNLFHQYQNYINKMVRSYHQNQRQTAEYCLKGLKAGTTMQVYQYFSYQKRIQKSWSKLMLFYSLALKFKNDHQADFYYTWIQDKLQQYRTNNKQISFNCDVKTMQNLFSISAEPSLLSGHFNEFYGYLNNVQAFKLEVKLRKTQFILKRLIIQKSEIQQKSLGQYLQKASQIHTILTKNTNISQLYSLENQFDLIDSYLKGQTSNKKTYQIKQNYTQRCLYKELEFFLKLSELKILAYKSTHSFIKLLKFTQKDQKLEMDASESSKLIFGFIQDIMKYFTVEFTWRQQLKKCWLLRETLFIVYHLIQNVDEESTKLKKLPKSIRLSISSFTKELQEVVLHNVTNLKFNENLSTQKDLLGIQVEKRFSEKLLQRDQILRRFVAMDLKEAKKYLLP